MFRRHLSQELIKALKESPFWRNICADHELQPEIRNGHITIYYKGRGLIRELRLENDRLTARTHQKYIPLFFPGEGDYVQQFDSNGLQFKPEKGGQPEPLGFCENDILKRYKECASARSIFPEGDLVQTIIRHSPENQPKNQIVDQEITFPGGSRDKIDICYFDTEMKKLVFVEVKRRDDGRLTGGLPEVLGQLEAYGMRLRKHRDEILDEHRKVVSWKRDLGLGERLAHVPENEPSDLLEKPLLVIGDCNRDDVSQIMKEEGEWKPLLNGLKDVAAGLIVCGANGCRLSLEGDQRKPPWL